jgi:dihydrofolate synthase/folylpolyglutamate synthase
MKDGFELTQPDSTGPPDSLLQADYQAAIGFLYDRINYEKLASGGGTYPFRLRRMVDLLIRLDLADLLHPSHRADLEREEGGPASTQDASKPNPPAIIHIAGTKGKGSTAMMASAMLSAAGYRTGTYTSPHLHRLEERFRIDGVPCTQQQLVTLVDQVRSVAESMAQDEAGSPTFFELTTAIAMLHFYQADCQAMVLEVGLGGRLDSTNVCDPAVSVITSIGLDHQHVLGDTKEAIAGEKAGIIKPGVPIVCGVTEDGPQSVIAKVATQQGARLFQLGRDFVAQATANPDWGWQVSLVVPDSTTKPPLRSTDSFSLSIEGEHQARNASLAIAAIEVLASQTSLVVDSTAMASALANLDFEGRIQRYRLPGDIQVVIDSAHNDDSIAALCDVIRRRIDVDQCNVTFVFGTSSDKVASPMIVRIAGLASSLILTRFTGNPRFTNPESLRSTVPADWPGSLTVEPDPIAACRLAVRESTAGSTIVVCGSFFLAAETRPWFAEQIRKRSSANDSSVG